MRIAVITGASSGLGSEYVKQLDKDNSIDKFWLVARRSDRLRKLSETLFHKVVIFSYDLTDSKSFELFAGELEKEKPEIKYLINCAGAGVIGSYKDISLSDSDRMIDLNCKAAVNMTTLCIPYMKRGSRIMEISSASAYFPVTYLNVYSASKVFLLNYSRALRREIMHEGICVTAVCPYWIKDTEFIGRASENGTGSYIKNFLFASKEADVVRKSLIDSKYNLAISSPGVIAKAQRIVGKLLETDVMITLWEFIRKIRA